VQAFNDLKLGNKHKWIIFKISDDWKEIVVEETSKDADYSAFREKLLNAKSKNKRGEEGIGGRYAVYDVDYDAEDGGKRTKITFISWVPDDAPQYVSPAFRTGSHCPHEAAMTDTESSTASHDVLYLQGGTEALA
jgi:cofilin